MVSRRLAITGILALAGCASLPSAGRLPATGPYPELESVRRVRIGPGELAVEVASRGCEGTPDLATFVERRGGVAKVAFARRRLKTCPEGAPGWVEVVFSRQALGLGAGEPVFVLNPLSSGPDR